MSGTVAVIDYGMGNIHSVSKALQHVGGDTRVVISSNPEEILRADHVVLPGVGALRDCMSELQRLELIEVVEECATSRPLLGICVGMQAMLERSEENDGTPGMGLFAGEVLHFAGRIGDDAALKIPHMGWNQVHQSRDDQDRVHPLWEGIAQDSRFYFVHSYFVRLADASLSQGVCKYGLAFSAAIGRDNVFAVQFHPEKSQHAGLALLGNFLRWDGAL